MPSPFRPATELLVQYARYHRDPRNITTHFIGIPMIVFAIGVLAARPVWAELDTPLGTLALSPALLLWLASTLWYLTRGQFALGLATSLVNGLLIALAAPLAAGSVGHWLGWGVGTFVVGWVFQFIGHYYEGRKPAFADDLVGLLVGPEFVVAEALFSTGLLGRLKQTIEEKAGPTRLRDLAAPTLG
ncbi:DUF962 domain-containing protein [Ideonella azotifigens]|uniref:DUF962 domain-containing protein n=1 Tax=Ideonella azotifigens TaxID=513160 RepID=A0ABP3VDI0_9BURK|nr:Mpo1-like protein [Ideonella azotifigens]MCD2341791.1 DUF962 domain-containing protein [Ideonella azotifigens]